MPQAFLFDIGRVLVQFDFSLAFARLAPLTGEPLPEAETAIRALLPALETGTLSTAEFLRRGSRLLGGEVTPHLFEEAYCGIFTLNAAMQPVVEKLAANFPLYLFSNTSELHERHLFRHYPVFRLFRGGIYSWRAGFMKPDPAIYTKAIALAGVPASHIAYIDDLPENIATGRSAGLLSHEYSAARHSKFEDWLASLGE
jgi:glucose-1-phosphatase